LVPTVAASRRKVEKGAFFNANFAQRRIESAQKFVAKASSDSASKFKFLAFIKTNQQRAKMFSRLFRFGVPTDDECLLLMELSFDPCSRALPGLIAGTAAFTNRESLFG
jgi:hypothetical protein